MKNYVIYAKTRGNGLYRKIFEAMNLKIRINQPKMEIRKQRLEREFSSWSSV